ncbi:hypothetical protein GCM10009780_66980 [Actinomadura alba]
MVLTSGTTQLWDVRSRRRILRRDSFKAVFDTSPDDRLFVVFAEWEIEVWDIPQRRRLPLSRLWPGPKEKPKGERDDLRFSPDGRRFARTVGNTLKVRDLTSGRTFEAQKKVSGPLAFSSDGKFITDGTTIWGLDNGLESPIKGGPRNPDCADAHVFGPGDRTLRCAGSNGAVLTMDISHYTRPPVLSVVEDTSGRVDHTAFGKAGGMLATESGASIRMWDVRSRRPTGPPLEVGSPDEAVTEPTRLSKDGRLLAHISGINVDIWDVRARRKVASLQDPAFGRDGTDRPGTGLQDMEFAPDGKSMALFLKVDGQRILQFWDVTSSQRIRSSPITASEPEDINDRPGMVFQPDGRAIAVGDGAGLFEFPSGRPLSGQSPPPGTVLALGPDGTTAAIASARSLDVFLWNPRTGETGGPPLRGHTRRATHAAFSPDGRLLATGDLDGAVRLWDAEDDRRFAFELTPNPSNITGLAFDATGRSLYTVSWDGALREHALDLTRATSALCTATGGPLTKAEWRKYIPEIPHRRTC